MRITADTNLIVRVLAQDDPEQFETARRTLEEAEAVAFPIVALCETAWVLRRTARWSSADMALAFRTMLDDPRALVDRRLVDAGLALLDAGGDFADGVIAADGHRLGAEIFATFDRNATDLLDQLGEPVTLLR